MKNKKRTIYDLFEMEENLIEQEWYILTYSIMSDSMIKFVYNKYKQKEIKTKHFVSEFQIIFKMLLKYYKKYQKAPRETIQALFENQKTVLNEDTIEIVDTYLERLSEEYLNFQENSDENGINPEYIRTDIIPEFIKKREAEILIERLQKNLDRGDYEEIDKSISKTNLTLEAISHTDKPTNIVSTSWKEAFELLPSVDDWYWPFVYPKGEPCMLVAKPGAGKSSFAIQSVLEKRIPRNLLKFYICAETPVSTTKKVIEIFGRKNKDPEKYNFIRVDLIDNQMWDLSTEEGLNDLKTYLENEQVKHKKKIGIIFIDTLGKALGNRITITDDKIGLVMERITKAICENFGCTLCWIHHLRKSKPGEKQNIQVDEVAGYHQISASVRHVVAINRIGEGRQVLTIPKSNYTDTSDKPFMEGIRLNEIWKYKKIDISKFDTTKISKSEYAVNVFLRTYNNPEEISSGEVKEISNMADLSSKQIKRKLKVFGYKFIKRKNAWIKKGG